MLNHWKVPLLSLFFNLNYLLLILSTKIQTQDVSLGFSGYVHSARLYPYMWLYRHTHSILVTSYLCPHQAGTKTLNMSSNWESRLFAWTHLMTKSWGIMSSPNQPSLLGLMKTNPPASFLWQAFLFLDS